MTTRPTIPELIRRAQRSAPVDVKGLAHDLMIEVRETWLNQDTSGQLIRIDVGRYAININAAHPKTRQRFTLSHEIGHFVLHRDLIGKGLNDDLHYRCSPEIKFYNPKIGPRQETQANRFATDLLMPIPLIRQMQTDGLAFSEIAKRLEVTEQALAIRLRALENIT